jgi:hypothetical protein
MPVQSFVTHVEDLDSVMSVFDQIQVWKSPDELGAPTPYVEITAASPTKATIDGTVVGPWALDGKTLIVTLNNGEPITIEFSGTDPLNINQVIATINAIFSGLAKEVPTDTNKIRLESSTTGTASALQVSGTAVAVLGFSTGKVNGRAARMNLTAPTTEYEFRDFDGLETDWYKTRYFSSATGTVSSYSEPTQGNPVVVIPAAALLRCFVFLADGAGRPVVDRRIIFIPISKVTVADNLGNLYGSLPSVDRIVGVTDEKGFAELFMVRGQTFKVFFEGTTFQREITIPTDPLVTELNVLEAMSTALDPFTIVQSPPMPIRVS